jgi:hypothetical protein
MTRTELGQTPAPAQPDQEDPDRNFILENYLSLHLEDLRSRDFRRGYGVWVKGREIESELAGEIVDTFLEEIEDSLATVSNYQASEKLVYFDHPTQEYSLLSQAHQKWPVDYDVLDYIYRRCLYAHLCFGLYGHRSVPPGNEEELADLEAQFKEKRVVGFFNGRFNVNFVCSVKPIQIDHLTVYQRRWVVQPGPPTKWEEEFEKRFGLYFEGFPEPKEAIASFEVDSTDSETGEPDIGMRTYHDKGTGKPMIQFKVVENWYVSPVTIERDISEFDCKPITYESPLSGEVIEAEKVTIRTWSTDKSWRKRSKEGYQVQVLVFFEDWSPEVEEPREIERVLEESAYEQFKEKGGGVWIEKRRSIFQGSGETTFYIRNDQEKMVLAEKGDPEELSIPRDLGEARTAFF